MSEGRIQRALSGFYDVRAGERTVRCRARGRFRRERLSPLVGDLVRFTETGADEGVIDEILPRRNQFDRPAVANVDLLTIVASGAIPRTDPYLIDRMTAVASLKNCGVLICVNKCDLDAADALCGSYAQSGYPVLRVSAETGEGVDLLANAISGKVCAFTGDSGVGKSSLLRALDPRYAPAVGEVSRALGRGRHTTRHVELYALSCGADVIDTPGFSSYEAEGLEPELKRRLPETFPEFSPYLDSCRFVGCSHTKEKDCAVLRALREGKIAPSRHASYVRMYEELKKRKEWQK